MATDKKQIARLILDGLGALVGVYVLWSINQINDLVQSDFKQNIKIEAMGETLNSVSGSVASMEGTLTKMVFEQALANQIALLRIGDRWTAGMQVELQEKWFNMMEAVVPELDHNQLPDVRQIQARHPEGRVSSSL